MGSDIGVVGVGSIAATHLENLRNHSRARIRGICDVDPERASSIADSYDARPYTDIDRLCREADLDAVFICVPPFAHGDPELTAIEHGLDLFIEKPLGLESETAQQIETAIDDASVFVQVGYMLRYAPIVEKARELVGDRPLTTGTGHWWSGLPSTDWWRKFDQSGGQVIEQATHTYDLARYFLGDVSRVQAAGSQRIHTEAIDFPDATGAVLTHDSGAVSQLAASSAAPDHRHGLSLIGEDLVIDLDLANGAISGVVDGDSIELQVSGDPYAAEVDAFLEAIEERDSDLLRSPYSDARQTFETTLAVNEAIETGTTVTMEGIR